jgi:hypothetical protein
MAASGSDDLAIAISRRTSHSGGTVGWQIAIATGRALIGDPLLRLDSAASLGNPQIVSTALALVGA